MRLLPSPSESARFGIPTARLTVTRDASVEADQTAAQVRTMLDASESTVVILRYPSEAVGLIGRLRLHKRWAIYPGGTLSYWEAPAYDGAPEDAATRRLEVPAEHEDSEVSALLLDSFDGYVNHYAANPLLPNDAAAAGYAEWAQTIAADSENHLSVVRDAGRLVGVAVTSVEDGVWDIRLAGIASDAQRRGHYRRLIRDVEHTAHEAGAARLIISTQAHNIGVQRAWASFGWRPFDAIDTVHLVRLEAI